MPKKTQSRVVNQPRIVAGAVVLAAGLWAYGCDDGEPPAPTELFVTPSSAELSALGDTARFSARVVDQYGDTMANVSVSWSSSDTSVTVVNGAGLVTAEGNGRTTVRAAAGAASGKGSVAVEQVVSAVNLSPPADSVLEADTVRFSAEAVDANGHAVEGAGFDWATGDTLVAVVDGSGLVTGVADGEVAVTAVSSGETGTAGLTVVEPVPTSVSVMPDTAEFTALGQTLELTAEVRDQIGRVMEGVPVSWSSGDTSVAVVDSVGVVTAAGNGRAAVIATAGAGSGSAAVTVAQVASAVKVSPAADTVLMDDTVRLEARAFDANGHPVAGAEFSWSSGEPSVATVDGQGLVTGVREGVATIEASVVGAAEGTSEITVRNPDRVALTALYNATDGPNWVNAENWLTDLPLWDWHGVSTDGSGRVSSLDLAGRWDDEGRLTRHGLVGAIPMEIGHLANLESLDLSWNDLAGAIPPELGKLANLESLDLGWNDLAGAIPPELGKLANLESLALGGNDLAGAIPPELGDLANLESLDLSSNDLAGAIPPDLGDLGALRSLSLWSNDLAGAIPPELGGLANLNGLRLSMNRLSGSVPPELGDLGNLEYLAMAYNRLTGPLPRELLGLLELQELDVSGNTGLCAPGVTLFVDWSETMEAFWTWCNESDRTVLESLHEATDGPNWRNTEDWLGGPALEEWHGVDADSLGLVTTLDLEDNGLEGELPGDLGLLAEMTELRIGDNDALAGRLPRSLIRLSLDVLHYAGTDLCAPGDNSFREWLDGISSHRGTGVECVRLTEREVLERLYDATEGESWADNGKWLSNAPLGEWYGVESDDSGRVVGVRLAENELSGAIPSELGDLGSLESLDLADNGLSGAIPSELGRLANLRSLRLAGNVLSRPIPLELGGLADLESLSLADNELSGPIPPELGGLANLRWLDIGWNELSGAVPSELGDLASLERLVLVGNGLSGAIPSELGGLANLRELRLSVNMLSGPVPPELGDLADLEWLDLAGNELSGPIPPELGDLANLKGLNIGPVSPEFSELANRLSGPIPPELGGLANLEELGLGQNELSGPIPPELGDLANLRRLSLFRNRLSGPVPPELGNMSSLLNLQLANNTAMDGALPSEMTSLSRLDTLVAGGTGLCAPVDSDFRTWLEGVVERWIRLCTPSEAYVTQAVQSREFPVPLVGGEKALLRVFPTANRETDEEIPLVRARFYHDGEEVHEVDIPGKSTPIPTEVDEGDLDKSANVEIPDSVVKTGLEMVIEIDPDSTLDEELGVTRRIPEEGRMAVEVGDMPVLDLTLIPFVWTETHDSSIVEVTEAMEDDPEGHELFRLMFLLPVGEMEVAAHEPVLSSSNDALDLLEQTATVRALEGGVGHYKGMMSAPVTSASGVAFLPGRSSFSIPYAGVITHELGHNMFLWHAPCGGAGGPDPSYPYRRGNIGAWGYDFEDDSLVNPLVADLMSYCTPPGWISDYHFARALRFRLSDADNEELPGPPKKSLLLRGGTGADGVPFLEPVFVVDAPPLAPDSSGAWLLVGLDPDESELFSLSFDMPEVADGDGRSSFVFVLPAQASWEGDLVAITLSGPGGEVALEGDADAPAAILRDRRTGRVRGILRDLPGTVRTRADAAAAISAGRGVEVLFSRGIPGAAEWRR